MPITCYVGVQFRTADNASALVSISNAGLVSIASTTGIAINSGADVDHDIINLEGITGGGKLIWDHSATSLDWNKNLSITGNVGIGTSSPSSYLATKLVLGCADEDGMTLAATSGSTKQNIYFADGTSGSARNRGNLSYDHADDSLRMGTAAGHSRFVMDSTGTVLVPAKGVFGTDNASTHGVDKALNAITAGNANQQLGLYDTLADSSTRYSAVFHRVGTNASMTWVGSISNASSSVSFNTTSDYRLKENVSYTWDATTRLKGLKPCRFNFIADDTNTLVDGFLAHEVSSYCPQAVMEEKDGDIMQSIDHSKLVPLLVKTIQELEARITILEA